MVKARRGFTLVETMVALSISSVVVVLVSTVFLVQNEYYALQLQRVIVHDNARSVTELLAAEIRSAMAGGITLAARDSMTVRTPIVVAAVCGRSGSDTFLQFDEEIVGMDTGEIAGFAVMDGGSATWDYHTVGWSSIDGSITGAQTQCAANGANVVGAVYGYYRLRQLGTYHDSLPPLGSLVMVYRETTYTFRTSELDPSQRALFRRLRGKSAVEYATGMDPSAGFQYRRAGLTTYSDQLTTLQAASVDAVRVIAEALKPTQVGGRDDVEYGWGVNVPLRNVR